MKIFLKLLLVVSLIGCSKQYAEMPPKPTNPVRILRDYYGDQEITDAEYSHIKLGLIGFENNIQVKDLVREALKDGKIDGNEYTELKPILYPPEPRWKDKLIKVLDE